MVDLKEQISKLPEFSGIYFYKDGNNKVIYVGKAKNLKKRVTSYFTHDPSPDIKLKNLLSNIKHIEYIAVNSELEALLLEAELIKIHRPKYNSILKDDKHYLYIEITKEEFPRIVFSRKRNTTNTFFGPYPSASAARKIVGYLRRVFPFCTQKVSNRACFYSHIGLCSPCPSEIMKLKNRQEYLVKRKIYRQNIHNLNLTLEGKLNKVKLKLQQDMQGSVKNEKYEEAAVVRDLLHKLEYISTRFHTPDIYLEGKSSIFDIRLREVKNLKDILSTFYTHINLPKIIECYDISNISGKFTAASLVTFIDAAPAKSLYKRFKIRLKKTPDDAGAIKEVIERRLNHPEWKLPDLLIVDGGKPQVSAMKSILDKKSIDIPLIGLAKRDEEIVIPHANNFRILKLPPHSPALTLIQRLRDEAHRFAHKYHELLRLKYLLAPNLTN
ncbi:hypothetical protein A2773_05805 [Candidatus Gottesmanbacteria bacterium RIFCSPHIGHO2_01_FULL_39_10]|uniref:Excinuclease ABC subunit C n=1 Tax=Candidatus Gottesmanbacteria bacterium RIFCSPHIGHO2_01_FULL_39_10 TaxID=1798375 RepID=A0A1F5ZKE7_9BACT|nr:MAG: hypothetical protein A2773_05805 [Candidatus Gottesmanbacteria bacterium RIFCSPHIGHO2_01_FULL_39_10]